MKRFMGAMTGMPVQAMVSPAASGARGDAAGAAAQGRRSPVSGSRSSQKPILIMAGGTGGHIFPGLAVAASLRERGVPVAWLGADGGMETRLVPGHGIPMHTVSVGGLRGKGLATRLFGPLRLVRAVWAAMGIVRRVDPASVLSMGGYAAGPGGLAAWLLRRPLLVHEQNRVPGVTNTWLAKMARHVMAGFADAFPPARKAEWVGNPVRADIAALPEPDARFAGRGDRLRLLVLGGSLGARTLNLRVPEAVAAMAPEVRPDILHQCGRRGEDEARQAYADAAVEARIEPFIADMAATYAWADLVVCRAGALTVAELAAAGLGAVLVPFPHAVDDHQTRNAQALVEVGAARIVQERDMDETTLGRHLAELARDRAGLRAMARAARTLARPNAANVIATRCMEAA